MKTTNLLKLAARNAACTVLTLALLLGCVHSVHAAPAKTGWDLLPEILSRIVPPTFRAEDFVITKYGAAGDGVTDCNPAFKKAIAACTKAGGGRVVVPRGIWLTDGPIHLDNNVNLHISKGATIKFGTNFDDYLPHVLVRWAGTECYSYSPLIYAYKKTNIAVTGSGTLDGQAKSSWVTWQSKTKPGTIINMDLRKMGAEGVPVEKRIFYGKPSLILPFDCKNVLIEGVNIRDYPFWCLHLTYCINVTVRNVMVVDATNPNNDGCNADSCTDMLIENCGFNTRDDSICVKAGRDQDGWRVGKPSQNIIVRNMTDWHGLAIGSEMSGGVQNVFLQNCSMDRGAAVYMKSNLDRGGFIRDIYVKDIKIGKGPILLLRNNYHGYRGGNYPADFRDIFVENVTIKEADRGAIFIAGAEGASVKNIFIKNSTVEKAAEPVTEIQYAENVVLDNVYANGRLQPAHPKPIPLAEKKIDGIPSITPIRSGKWSESAIWNTGRDSTIWNGAPAGRLPDGTTDRRVLIGKKEAAPVGVTTILDVDIDDTYEVRIYEKSALVIPSGRTLKIGTLRLDRTNCSVRQTGGNLISPRLHIDDVTCQYLITGGYMQVAALLLGEGSLTIDDSAATITSISVADVFQAGSGTTITFVAHAGGVTPVRCKDVTLTGYLGQHLIVDVSKYDHATNGDLTLVSYTGTRTGKFDGGAKKPGPQVTVIGGRAELVYDDAEKKIKLTNFEM